MGNAVFPTLPGLMFNQTRTPIWKTITRETVSGREFRTGFMASPRYRFKLQFEFLRQDAVNSEFRTLLGFFNSQQGSMISFLYSDPDDNAVTAQAFGTGDASTTQFQLTRTLGGFAEPVYAVNGTPTIYVNGVAKTAGTDYTIGSTGIVTFTAAPAASAALTWTGSYYWRVRFLQDTTEFNKFMAGLFEAKSIEFESVKP